MRSRIRSLSTASTIAAVSLGFAFGSTANATPFTMTVGKPVANNSATVLVGHGSHGGHGGHMGHGGGGGMPHFAFRGSSSAGRPAFRAFNAYPRNSAPHVAYGGHDHGHHHRRGPFIVGRPFYGYNYGRAYFDDYYDYAPDYNASDDYYDDGDRYADDRYVNDSGDAVARCRARYRSFDIETGTYLRTDGTRRLCPYLG